MNNGPTQIDAQTYTKITIQKKKASIFMQVPNLNTLPTLSNKFIMLKLYKFFFFLFFSAYS